MVMLSRDAYGLGILLGMIMPIVSFFGYYYWKFRWFTLTDFFTMLQQNKQLVTALSIPCLLLNVVLFTLYINGKKDKTAKGIFLVSVVYAIGALLFKWFY